MINCELVRKIVESEKVLNVEVKMKNELLDTGIIDSFSILVIIEKIKKEYGVDIQLEGPIREVFSTVEQICQFIQSKIKV
jgi:acyl carrier protein